MGWVDAVLLGILVFSILIGLVRGLVFELMSLLGWVVAYFSAHWLAASVAPHLPIGEPGSGVNEVAAFVATFIAALMLWTLASRLVRLLVRATPLSLVDRLLGALFGLLRGALALLVAATLVSMTPLNQSEAWQASAAVPWLQSAVGGLKPLLPSQISKHLPA